MSGWNGGCSEVDIKTEAESFFKEFLQHKPEAYTRISVGRLEDLISFRCSKADHIILTKYVLEEEIKDVIFATARNKSPGPDGYTTEFFTSVWPIVGKELIIAIQYFFVVFTKRHKLKNLSPHS